MAPNWLGLGLQQQGDLHHTGGPLLDGGRMSTVGYQSPQKSHK